MRNNRLCVTILCISLKKGKRTNMKSISGKTPPNITAGMLINFIDLPEIYEADKCPNGVIEISDGQYIMRTASLTTSIRAGKVPK